MGTQDVRAIEAIKSRLLQALADLDSVSGSDREAGGQIRHGLLGRDTYYDELEGGRTSGLAAIARRLLKQSDGRAEYFEEDLFADPAWHILLDLFAAAAEGKTVSIKSLSLAARVPQTTGLRWIRHLENRGLIERAPDEKDSRRAFVTMSPEAFANMAAYLARISDLGNMVSPVPEGRRPLRRLRD